VAGLFGTDGVRGVANRDLTPELAFAIGRAVVLALDEDRPTVLVGRDTRVSGPMLQAALSAGVCSAGGDVVRVGVVPTPAVAYLTVELGAQVGVAISASHNPPEYNGIKLFSGRGMKLPDDAEESIEGLVRAGDGARPEGTSVGRVTDLGREIDRYLEHLTAAAEAPLQGMRLVVDCAWGAAYRLAPQVLRRLGAEVLAINDRPEGERINVACGATHPGVVAEEVRRLGADAGVTHDGDADRALFSDARGNLIDGDQVIAACALAMKEEDRLPKDTVVVTVMANLGLRRAMEARGITVAETQVGDRFVLEEMLRTGAGLGGEQSGHVIFLDHATTGDGLLTAVRFLSLVSKQGRTVEGLASVMERFPQVLKNVPAADPSAAAASPALIGAVEAARETLGDRGRVLIRPSGTEPVVRIMVEAESDEEARRQADALAEAVAQVSQHGRGSGQR
jgi:phosphoglucosamine mutase